MVNLFVKTAIFFSTLILGQTYCLAQSEKPQTNSNPTKVETANSKSLLLHQARNNFLDLKYNKIKPNTVSISQKPACKEPLVPPHCQSTSEDIQVAIKVESSSSPLFYKLNQKVKRIDVTGQVQVTTPMSAKKDDSYFQLGLIYEGEFRPNFFTKAFLPDWLKAVVNIDPTKGIGDIFFYEASADEVKLNKVTSSKGIDLNFKTATQVKWEDPHKKTSGGFQFSIQPQDKKLLGLWLRSDGDDSKATFTTTIQQITIE